MKMPLKLHRVEGQTDWQDVPPEDWNSWQKVAAGSGGVVTIGNFFSLLGLLSVPYGLWLIAGEHFIAAIAVLAIGRLCDLIDGGLADKTGTKSPLGEKIDASFDKLSTAAVLIGLVALDVLPGLFAVLIIAPHVLIAVIALTAFARGNQFHPSRTGKLSMAAIWWAILVFIGLQAMGAPDEGWVWLLAIGSLIAAVGLGAAALAGYLAELIRTPRET